MIASAHPLQARSARKRNGVPLRPKERGRIVTGETVNRFRD
jgi:hypothetical protein